MSSQPAANAHIYLLTNAYLFMDNAVNPESKERTAVAQALFSIYDAMTSFERQFPEQSAQSAFVNFWGASVSDAYERVIAKAIANNDPHLQQTEWLIRYYDPHLAHISHGEKSLLKFLEHLDQNRGMISDDPEHAKLVSEGWDAAAIKFHRENGADCTAGDGCPSKNCGAKAIMEAAKAKGFRPDTGIGG